MSSTKSPRILIKIFSTLAGGAGLILLMLFMIGTFTPNRVGPETAVPQPRPGVRPDHTTKAMVEKVLEKDTAVGTVRPRTESRVESQVTARVLEVRVRPGDRVDKGDVLIVLDSSQPQSRVDQARQGQQSAMARKRQAGQAVVSARAVLSEAESAFRRTKKYYESEAATKQDLERAESSYLQAKAGLERVEQSLREAEAGVRQASKLVEESRIALGYNRIEATDSGEVAKRLVEPGDLAWPGKTLIVLQTRGSLRLESLVREGLIDRIRLGEGMEVSLDALDLVVKGAVEEIVPSADPQTRTFMVKVGLPEEKGLYPGMFGRLLVPLGEREIVTVPREAVIRVGQLEMVTVQSADRWERVFVKTGRSRDGRVEVLSGLNGGETIALTGGAP
jgi:RND family efflux transporter MFP subunit